MISKKFCPNCGSEEIVMIAGGVTGSWICKNCSYSGSVFPEKEFLGKEQKVKNKKRLTIK